MTPKDGDWIRLDFRFNPSTGEIKPAEGEEVACSRFVLEAFVQELMRSVDRGLVRGSVTLWRRKAA